MFFLAKEVVEAVCMQHWKSLTFEDVSLSNHPFFECMGLQNSLDTICPN